ncbi:MAG: DUF4040 domain-containing protein [Pegethrix bostrychoides GSE-TBD4-15B]|jgi:putative multicomponent Na+:H+ antiporter subunit B|uniref:DUF4040 domain-containing protein n=1 Tax=Pegethrix bostrychoides GSE-TBD4-15B TaxID=2839662 RepID=A0A951U5B4_9CYAN|nr:DUF4040 domain-containing protein [Pegethrix bostrychoides GSE-TBD4-15B]
MINLVNLVNLANLATVTLSGDFYADIYIYLITALLPLSACLLVVQTNPYHALVIRAVLGAIAALVYAVLGAADVALTEALMGTMLAITLYAVAVHSSMVLRLGVLQTAALIEQEQPPETPVLVKEPRLAALITTLRDLIRKQHLRLELVPYPNRAALQQGLTTQEIHAACAPADVESDAIDCVDPANHSHHNGATSLCQYQIATRLQSLHDILQAELAAVGVDTVVYAVSNLEEQR